MDRTAGAAGIAVIHSVFNVSATLILLPFSRVLEKLAYLTIPESRQEQEIQEDNIADFQLLDIRFLDTPGYAVEQSRMAAAGMAKSAKKALIHAVGLLDDYNEDEALKVNRLEHRVDQYEDRLGSYLVKLGTENLSRQDSRTISMLLHCIGDFERISDHAVNIAETALELHRKKTQFSPKAKEELKVCTRALMEIMELSVEAFEKLDYQGAADIEPLEETVDYLTKKLKTRHVERLREGECTIELGFALSDLTTNFERVSDHCSNVAIALIQSQTDSYEAHEYTAELYRENSPHFQEVYSAYKEKYRLP